VLDEIAALKVCAVCLRLGHHAACTGSHAVQIACFACF
jgi:hypothetical protein